MQDMHILDLYTVTFLSFLYSMMTNELDSLSKPIVSTLNPFRENSDATNSKLNIYCK